MVEMVTIVIFCVVCSDYDSFRSCQKYFTGQNLSEVSVCYIIRKSSVALAIFIALPKPIYRWKKQTQASEEAKYGRVAFNNVCSVSFLFVFLTRWKRISLHLILLCKLFCTKCQRHNQVFVIFSQDIGRSRDWLNHYHSFFAWKDTNGFTCFFLLYLWSLHKKSNVALYPQSWGQCRHWFLNEHYCCWCGCMMVVWCGVQPETLADCMRGL